MKKLFFKCIFLVLSVLLNTILSDKLVSRAESDTSGGSDRKHSLYENLKEEKNKFPIESIRLVTIRENNSLVLSKSSSEQNNKKYSENIDESSESSSDSSPYLKAETNSKPSFLQMFINLFHKLISFFFGEDSNNSEVQLNVESKSSSSEQASLDNPSANAEVQISDSNSIARKSSIDKNTQLFNLAWSNSENQKKTSVPESGNNNIVLLDGDVDAREIDNYKQHGYRVAGYISVGSWENYRNDRSNFSEDVFGKPYEGWSDETLFIVSKWKKLIPGMTQRMKKLSEKGFQLVEFDNIDFDDGDKADMIAYAKALSNVAASNSLSPIFKNGAKLIMQDSSIVNCFDGFIIESALQYEEVSAFSTLTDKPCWFFEYDGEYNGKDKNKVQSWMTNVWKDTSSGWQKIK